MTTKIITWKKTFKTNFSALPITEKNIDLVNIEKKKKEHLHPKFDVRFELLGVMSGLNC